jgi:hypothetical protein
MSPIFPIFRFYLHLILRTNKMRHIVALCDTCIMLNISEILQGGVKMTTAVRVSEELVNEARKFSRIDRRSLTGQIEHWARIGKCAEENPTLTYDLIKEILVGIDELDHGEKSEYQFG